MADTPANEPQDARRTLLPGVFRNRQFARLWAATSISMFGNQLTFYALPIATYQLSGSAGVFASVMVASSVGLIVPSLVGGALTDRFDRRRLLLINNALLAPIVLAMGVCVSQHAWTALVALALVQSTIRALFRSADALRRDMVPEHQRLEANAVNQASIFACTVLSPLFGVALLSFAGFALVAVVDAGTFVAGFLLLLGVRDPAERVVAPQDLTGHVRTTVTDVGVGLGLVRRDRFLRLVVLSDVVFGLGYGVFMVNLLPWLDEVHHLDAGWYGGLVTVAAVAGLATSLALARFGARIEPIRLWKSAVVAGLVALVAYVGVAPTWLLVACFAVGAVDGALVLTAYGTIVQARYPSVVQGRIGSVSFLTFQVAFLVGLGAAGLAQGSISSVHLMQVYVLLAIPSAVLGWRAAGTARTPVAQWSVDVSDSELATSG
ncbi:MAG: transporter [Thermoleophilia bacterium]|nr:transporter [Thermoleophilia bacterium]